MTDESELTTCTVINTHDNERMTLCTHWFDWGLKMNVFTTNSIVFTGQIETSDIDKFAKGLSKTRSEYLELTKRILSGKDKGVEYVMKDSKLRWKKGKWNYGMIDVGVDRLEELFPDLLAKLLQRHTKLEESVDAMRLKTEELREAKERLDKKVEDVIEVKDEMERDIYRRFMVVLNSKKEMIRELKEELSKTRGIRDGENMGRIYDAETEGSDDSDQDKKDKVVVVNERDEKINSRREAGMNLKRFFNRSYEDEIEHKLIKRQISDSDGKMSDSECEGGGNGAKYKEARPSTSGRNNERNAISFDSEESEEDMFA